MAPILAALCFEVAFLSMHSEMAWGQQVALGFNENVVYVDAGHGGVDAGAHLGGDVEEKDVTAALAGRVKGALAAKGFTVVGSRDGDAAVTAEQRAGVANHARPLACILLHASASGSGVALAVSTLAPYAEQGPALPWGTAQAGYVSQSLGLRELLAGALGAGKVKTVALRASTPPIDSLTCAAVTVEVMGAAAGAGDLQQKVADAVAQAVGAWKAQVVSVKEAPVKEAPVKEAPVNAAPANPVPGAAR